MKPLVIYHANCADGFGAAFAAWLKLGSEAEYLPMQYGAEAQLNILALRSSLETREVYILDFSFEIPTMNTLFSCAKRVVWLDHHKTAFEMRLGYNKTLAELAVWERPEFYRWNALSAPEPDDHWIELNNNKSGALLAWEYFHPGKEIPMLIKHIDDYDRWQFKIEGTKEFNKALWSYAPWSFEQWEIAFLPCNDFDTDGDFGSVLYASRLDEGAAILRAHEQNVLAVVESAGRSCSFDKTLGYEPQFQTEHWQDNLEGLAANCPPHLASDVGHELANRSGTYGLLWHVNKEGKCICSLRSNGDYDVSAIAKAFGGGGHKNAAGFEVDINSLLSWIA